MESPKSLLLRIQIGRHALSVEGEPHRNPARREQTHDAQGSDPSSSVPAEVDDETVNFPQFLDCSRDFVCHFDSDHPREHRNLQIAKPVFQMARLNQCRLNKMELLPLGPRYIDRTEA